MALHRREVGLVVVIRQLEFTGGAPQDATDVGVESVADPRKQMMLDLEVQTSGEPVQETVVSKPAITTERDFRNALLLLDRTIMSFVSNPLFKNANTIEVQQGASARRDLESVLDLTADLKKSAVRLGKEQ